LPDTIDFDIAMCCTKGFKNIGRRFTIVNYIFDRGRLRYDPSDHREEFRIGEDTNTVGLIERMGKTVFT